MTPEPTHRFTRDGPVVIAKPTKDAAQKLTTKDVVNAAANARDKVREYEEQLKQLDKAKTDGERELEVAKATAHEITKHEDWALEVQRSRLQHLINEVKDEAQLKVESTYKTDVTLSAEQNDRQRFVQYRGYIATNPRVAEEIAARVIKDVLFENCILTNPWLKTGSTVL